MMKTDLISCSRASFSSENENTGLAQKILQIFIYMFIYILLAEYLYNGPRKLCNKSSLISSTGNPCGITANILDCTIIVSWFKLQLHSCIHYWTNALGKGMNSLIPLSQL